MANTVSIDLVAARSRGGHDNRGTVGVAGPGSARSPLDLCFAAAYPAFAGACRAVDEPGVAIVAVDERTRQAVGLARVVARPDRHVAAVIGRHDHADVFLAGPETLALRHAVVVVDPVRRWDGGAEVSYRVLDLHTEAGLEDEHGRRLLGLRAEGPAILRCPGHALFVLPLGDATDWPESAVLAWSYLPERVYLDEHADPRVARPRPVPDLRRSVLSHTRGPRGADGLLRPGEDVVAELGIRGPGGSHRLAVGASALDDGILLGRYARCDGSYLFAADDSVSRVHLLLVRVGDRVVAVDTGSTFGTRRGSGERFRATRLGAAERLVLGAETEVWWRGPG